MTEKCTCTNYCVGSRHLPEEQVCKEDYLDLDQLPDESQVYGIDCRNGRCEM